MPIAVLSLREISALNIFSVPISALCGIPLRVSALPSQPALAGSNLSDEFANK
jgi:hypothetical protein